MLLPKFNKKLLYITGSLLLLVVSLTGIHSARLLNSEVYYDGVSIENIPLKALSQDEALEKVKVYSDSINTSGTFTFTYEGSSYTYNIKSIGFSYLYDKAIKDAFNLGRTGGIAGRLIEINNIKRRGIDMSLQYTYNADKLTSILKQLQSKLNIPEKGARVFYKNGKFTVLKETIGKKLNINKTLEVFDDAIKNKNFGNIPLIVEDAYPSSLSDKIREIDSVIASASTSFSTQDVNRSYNIKYACEKLDGTVIMPGETFSMNTALGPRTIENGYRDAKVIMADELVDGPGGGVCQVTTTLYVAVLKSMLGITERMHHSFPLGYVPPGQDATIADGYIDFKFTNDKDYPVSINAETSGGNIIIRILSKKLNQYTVKLRSEVLETIDPEPNEVIVDKSLAPGESIVSREARQGKHVQVFREVYDNKGTLIEKTKISDDLYRPIRGQIKMN